MRLQRPDQTSAQQPKAPKRRRTPTTTRWRSSVVSDKTCCPKSTVKDNQSSPPMSALQAGKVTTFANGQKWTVENGKTKKG